MDVTEAIALLALIIAAIELGYRIGKDIGHRKK